MSKRWQIAQAAEIRWWNAYLRKKDKTEYLQWKRQYWSDLLGALDIKLTAGDKILDAGCGPAGIFMNLEQYNTDALDPLLDRYEKDLDHFERKAYPSINFYAQSLESFEATETYDKIFCLNAINHVDDLNLSFDRLVQYLKPDGTLIVSIDAHNHSTLKKIFRTIPGDILHPHQYDLEEYQKMLTDRNCTITQTLPYGKPAFFFNYYILVAEKK